MHVQRAGPLPALVFALLVALPITGLTGCGPSEAPPAPGVGQAAPEGPRAPVYPDEVVVAEGAVPEVVAYAEPSVTAPEVGRFSHPIDNGGPLVFQAVELRGDWLRVLLPVRPNGTTGWIRYADVTLYRNPYRVEVDVSDHRLTVLQANRPITETSVGIGTGATPTPLGAFYLTELLQPPDPAGPYGPYAFGLSGYSETLDSFQGEDAVIGIHGTNDPSSVGRDVSHGCIRVPNDVITDLASYLPLGTPVLITD